MVDYNVYLRMCDRWRHRISTNGNCISKLFASTRHHCVCVGNPGKGTQEESKQSFYMLYEMENALFMSLLPFVFMYANPKAAPKIFIKLSLAFPWLPLTLPTREMIYAKSSLPGSSSKFAVMFRVSVLKRRRHPSLSLSRNHRNDGC